MLRTTGLTGALAIAACVLCACSSGNSGDNNGTGGSGSGGSGGTGGSGGGIPSLCVSSTPAQDVKDVSGHWAFREVGSQLVQAPGFTTQFHTSVTSLLLVDLTQSGKDVTMKASYCSQTVDTDSVVKTVLPDAFVKALAPYTRHGTYEVTGGVGHFKLPDFIEVLGCNLASPAQDALPTDPTDSRVFDQDKDGKPGMTVKLTGLIDGEAYVVQRTTSSFDGAAVTKDKLQGKVGFKSEQIILDSQPSTIKNASPKGSVDPEACNSNFDAARLPAGADCQYIISNADTLFPVK